MLVQKSEVVNGNSGLMQWDSPDRKNYLEGIEEEITVIDQYKTGLADNRESSSQNSDLISLDGS